MLRPRLRARLLAVALGAIPLAAGGGAVAVATTPTPTPSPTPNPPTVICADPGPDSPGPYEKVTDITDRSATVTWVRYGCRELLDGYDVLVNDKVVQHVDGPVWWSGTAYLTDLYFNTTYRVEIIGTRTDGTTESIASTSFMTGPRDETGWFPTPTPTPSPSPTPGPTPFCSVRAPLIDDVSAVPVGVQANVKITWHHPPGCDNGVTSYRILIDDELVGEAPAGATSFTFTGLALDREYRARVVAIESTFGTWPSSEKPFTTGTGTPPTPTPTPFVTPTPTPTPNVNQPTTYAFQTRGGLAFRGQGLSGNFTLRGTASLTYGPLTPPYAYGTLPPTETTGNLLVAGVLPIKTTLALAGGQLAWLGPPSRAAFLNTDQTLVIRKASILGLVLTSGSTCKTTAPVKLSLEPSGLANFSAGGSFSGQFAVGRFTGCGVLDYYLSSGVPRSSLTMSLTPAVRPTPLPRADELT